MIPFSPPPKTYPTIEDLIEALESGDYAKSTGQFRVLPQDIDVESDCGPHNAGYCCLGVYATICGLSFSREQAMFQYPGGAMETKTRLPEGHWLLEEVHVDSTFKSAGFDVMLQAHLADINDQSPQEDGFKHVIRMLKDYAAGRRQFPEADIYIEEGASA